MRYHLRYTKELLKDIQAYAGAGCWYIQKECINMQEKIFEYCSDEKITGSASEKFRRIKYREKRNKQFGISEIVLGSQKNRGVFRKNNSVL